MKSTDNAGTAGFMYASVASRIMEQAIQQGVEAGVKAGAEYIEDQRRQAKKDRYDRRLHNTRLLLKNYRRFRAHVDEGVSSGQKGMKKPGGKRPVESAISILDDLDEFSYHDGLYIESIKRSQERTAIILRHIDKMMEYYRIDCDLNGTDEDVRRYKVVMASYIDEPKLSPQEIAEAFGIERRTIYRDINIAMKHLTALIFGIDGLRID